jgi:hypothetical protein
MIHASFAPCPHCKAPLSFLERVAGSAIDPRCPRCTKVVVVTEPTLLMTDYSRPASAPRPPTPQVRMPELDAAPPPAMNGRRHARRTAAGARFAAACPLVGTRPGFDFGIAQFAFIGRDDEVYFVRFVCGCRALVVQGRLVHRASSLTLVCEHAAAG